SIDYNDDADEPWAVAVLQGFVRNQGDGWAFTTEHLRREIEEARLAGLPLDALPERFALYRSRAALLGQRVAELHRALATPSGDPSFEPEPPTAEDAQRLRDAVARQAEASFAVLERVLPELDEP